VQGAISLQVPGYIHGTINGDIHSTARLYIGSSGVVNGNIEAEKVIIEGKVEGSVFAMRQAVIRENAIVNGNVNTSTLVLEKNGSIIGKVNTLSTDREENTENLKNTPDPVNTGEISSGLPPVTWF
jgi:cytoskeletal protein CcmA (bactofilin family)